MDMKTARSLIVVPAMIWMESKLSIKLSMSAEVMMLAIGGQESGWADRIQGLGDAGPARSFYQMEKMGAVYGLLTHAATKKLVFDAMDKLHISMPLDVMAQAARVHDVMAYNDTLATVMARLLLWTDPKPLPLTLPGNEQEGWDYYERNWRPGKPDRSRWTGNWSNAIQAQM